MKIILKSKLGLAKESLAKLQASQMANVKGGCPGDGGITGGPSCSCRVWSCSGFEEEEIL